MKKGFILILFTILVWPSSSVAGTKLVEVILGGVSIELPAPKGFSEVRDVSPQTYKRAEKMMTIPQNRLLALFVPDTALNRFLKNQETALKYHRYIMVQAPRGAESLEISSQEFQVLADNYRQDQNRLLKHDTEKAQSHVDGIIKSFSKEHEISMDLNIGQPRFLGFFAEGDNFIASALVTKVKAVAGGETMEVIMASASSFILIKNRLIFGWLYSKYDSQQDIDWIRTATKDWIKEIIAANRAGSN